MSSPRLPAAGYFYTFRYEDGRLVPAVPADAGWPVNDIDVRVDLYEHEDRLICGQVTVSSIPTLEEQEDTLGRVTDPTHISSALWRQLPIGRLVEDSIRSTRDLASEMYRETGRQDYERIAHLGDRRGRPGPRSTLTPELLTEVVVPAFKTGGRKSVQAVREAMEAAGYPGSGPDGGVTIDQARKAVQKARELELLARPQRAKRSQGES